MLGNTAINTSLKTHSVLLSLFWMSWGYQNDTVLRAEGLILRKWRCFLWGQRVFKHQVLCFSQKISLSKEHSVVLSFCDSYEGLVNSPRMYCCKYSKTWHWVCYFSDCFEVDHISNQKFLPYYKQKSQHDLVLNFDIHVFIGFPAGDLEFCFCVTPEDQNQTLIFLNILLKVWSNFCHFDLQLTAHCFLFIHLL